MFGSSSTMSTLAVINCPSLNGTGELSTAATGSSKENVAPCPGVLSTQSRPPR